MTRPGWRAAYDKYYRVGLIGLGTAGPLGIFHQVLTPGTKPSNNTEHVSTPQPQTCGVSPEMAKVFKINL